MSKLCRTVISAIVLALWSVPAAPSERPPDPLAWPELTRESRPWTRWWWLGSAVDGPNLTRLLEQYRDAGIGGVEICPIYGARGYEDRYLDFLSPKWMEMLAHTTAEAKRLGMGVDLTTGTGWPFGGPWVRDEHASSRLMTRAYTVSAGNSLTEPLPAGRLRYLLAVSDGGEQVDLTDRVKDRRLDWAAPAGQWRLYTLVQSGPVQKVKRAAPGGAGNVLDPYSVAALDTHLAAFDRAFAGFRGDMPRGHFHDSFEYFGASWTNDLFEQFKARRGYDLRTQIPALLGEGPEEAVLRVRTDYRETLADLHLDYVNRWTDWAHKHGGVSRNQAHGAPGNLIDLYAAADIPETEIFREVDERQVPMLKFSSSAAHLTGRALASSETFTWLGEHFQVPLADAKPAADFLFLTGVNHVFFHGVPYSPQDAGWPGWLFYASVHFGPNGGLWRDLPAFNAYLARCQSVLQSGRPANDVLLYFPVHDIWHTPGPDLLPTFTVHNQEKWLWPTPFYKSAMTLWERGYGFDEVSDRLLAGARVENGAVVLGGNVYRAIVLPRAKVIPPETMRRLIDLAEAGATVVVHGALPSDVPGFAEADPRRGALREALDRVKFAGDDNAAARQATLGKGKVLIGSDLDDLLRRAGVAREPMVDNGLRFIRRSHGGGHHYFVVNAGEKPLDGWVALGATAKSAVILDPRFDSRTGVAAIRQNDEGETQIYLQLAAGESIILRTLTADAVEGRPWRYLRPTGEPQPVAGAWRVRFIEGGPAVPTDFETTELASWASRADDEAKRFAGTAHYTIEFDRPAGDAADWVLDLGRVAETARVRINGRDVGTLWCRPFTIPVGEFLRPGRNTLEVEVTNLAANRIADLDRRKVNWKSFHEINFVNRDYKPFDASKWPPRDSGLLGPVRLVPCQAVTPQ